jgi:hypothetical protein
MPKSHRPYPPEYRTDHRTLPERDAVPNRWPVSLGPMDAEERAHRSLENAENAFPTAPTGSTTVITDHEIRKR